MAYRLIGTKQESEPVLAANGTHGNQAQWNYNRNPNSFIEKEDLYEYMCKEHKNNEN